MFIKGSAFQVFYTNDIQITLSFYQALGAEIKKLEADKVVVGIGDYDIHIILDSTEPFEDYKYVAEKKDYGNGVLLYVEVEDLEVAFEKVKRAGGTIKTEIKENHWEAKEFLFEDPNNYKFVFYK